MSESIFLTTPVDCLLHREDILRIKESVIKDIRTAATEAQTDPIGT